MKVKQLFIALFRFQMSKLLFKTSTFVLLSKILKQFWKCELKTKLSTPATAVITATVTAKLKATTTVTLTATARDTC